MFRNNSMLSKHVITLVSGSMDLKTLRYCVLHRGSLSLDIEAGINKRYYDHLLFLVMYEPYLWRQELNCSDKFCHLSEQNAFSCRWKKSWPFSKFFFHVVKNYVTSPCKYDFITVISRNETKNMAVYILSHITLMFNNFQSWLGLVIVNNSRNKELGKRFEKPDLIALMST